MNFFSLAVGTGASNQGVSAGVPPTARAVIGTCAGQKLTPATLTQTLIALTNASLAVDTDRRPKKLIQTLQTKPGRSF